MALSTATGLILARCILACALLPVSAAHGMAPGATIALRGDGVLLPGLQESPDAGPYNDLIRLLQSYAQGSTIGYRITPIARAIQDINSGNADFAFPMMKLHPGADDGKPYRFSSEAVGRVTFVLYSNKAKPLTVAAIAAAASAGKPYLVEAPSTGWGIPTQPVLQLEGSLKKLNLGRIDGFLWAQEDADQLVRRLKLVNIRRQRFQEFDEVILLPRSERGELADRVFSAAIRAARKSGRLQEVYARIHRPYEDWQPGQPERTAAPAR